MKRFHKIILKNMFSAVWIAFKLEHMAKKGSPEAQIYEKAQLIPERFHKSGHVTLDIHGRENIPEDIKGCLFIPNHQGQGDAMVVLQALRDLSTSFVINDARSHMFFMTQLVDALKAKRIKFDDPQDQLRVYKEMAHEISEGRRFILFPEAEYTDNKNTLQDFHAACMRPAIASHCPIIPVCLYDSWKIYKCDEEKNITVQCHFLKPICYEEYESMNRSALVALVKSRIQEKIDEIEKKKTETGS